MSQTKVRRALDLGNMYAYDFKVQEFCKNIDNLNNGLVKSI